MKNALLIVCAGWLALLGASEAQAQTAQPNPKPAAVTTAADKAAAARVLQLLEATGLGYTKAQENVWVIKYKGEQLSEFSVIVVYSQNMLIFACVVAEKKDYKTPPELLQKLLALNDDLDRVKIGIDKDDGNLFVRIDLSLRVVDDQEFKANLEQISAAVDETYAVLKPYLAAPKK
jgi:hypothetical protein